MIDLPFDTIEVRALAASRVLTAEQFVDIAFRERVRLVLSGKLTFYFNGYQVPMAECMKALRKMEAEPS